VASSGSVGDPHGNLPVAADACPDEQSLDAKTAEMERQLGFDLHTAGRIAWKAAIILARNNEATAADLVQESFARLVAALNAGTLEIRTNPTAYLRQVVRNVFISNQRNAANRSANDLLIGDMREFDYLSQTPKKDTPEAAAEFAALRDAISAAIPELNLSEDRRRTLSLLIDGHSITEISEMLGLPVSTVRSRVQAMQKAARNACRRSGWEVS
jgi:RNA polymerase sigma factor (sigma-70 family)